MKAAWLYVNRLGSYWFCGHHGIKKHMLWSIKLHEAVVQMHWIHM